MYLAVDAHTLVAPLSKLKTPYFSGFNHSHKSYFFVNMELLNEISGIFELLYLATHNHFSVGTLQP